MSGSVPQNSAEFFGDFDVQRARDILNLNYGWPNTLWARQLRYNYLAGTFIPANNDTYNDFVATSSVVYAASPLPTFSNVSASNTILAIDGPTLFTTNGAIFSSFTDAVGNQFKWVGASPPCFSAIGQAGQAGTAKGINFASAVGYFSGVLTNNAQVSALAADPRRLHIYISISSVATSGIPSASATLPKILFECSSSTGKGIGFAPVAQVMDHDNSFLTFGDVMFSNVSSTVINPAWGLIYANDGNPFFGTYWQGLIGSGSYIGSYNGKRMAPPVENAPVYGVQCYSPASSISSSALLYSISLKRSTETAINPISLFSIQPTNTCVDPVTNFPISQGALGDVSAFDFSGNMYLGNGSLNSSTTMFKGILYNLTVFASSSVTVPSVNTAQHRSLLKYFHSYFRYPALPKWTSGSCPNPCNTLYP